jgi:hypothetical protein
VGRNPLRVKIAASEGVRAYLDCSSPVLGSNLTQPTENPYPSKKRLLGEDMQICISSDCISCASMAARRKRERERRRRVRDLWRLTPLVFYYLCYRSGQVFSVDTVYPVSIQSSNDDPLIVWTTT